MANRRDTRKSRNSSELNDRIIAEMLDNDAADAELPRVRKARLRSQGFSQQKIEGTFDREPGVMFE